MTEEAPRSARRPHRRFHRSRRPSLAETPGKVEVDGNVDALLKSIEDVRFPGSEASGIEVLSDRQPLTSESSARVPGNSAPPVRREGGRNDPRRHRRGRGDRGSRNGSPRPAAQAGSEPRRDASSPPYSVPRTPYSGEDVVVIGGGITGLAAAHKLMELRKSGHANARIHVLEASPTLGGSLKTKMEHGCLLEAGPDSMITDKPWGVDLIKRLGMEDEIVGTDPHNRKSFVAAQGKLVPVPEGFYLMAPMKWGPWITTPILSLKGKLRALWERWTPSRSGDTDESVGEFVRRRFGEEVYTRLAEPMLGGIYAADADTLSIKATFPRFVEMEKQYGSVLKGLRKSMASKKGSGISGPRYGMFIALRGGMASLVENLVKSLPRGAVRTNAEVTQLERLPDGRWRVVIKEGPSITAKSVILALPSYAAAHLIQRYDPYLAQEMEGITYGSSATINLVYRRREIPHPLDGFGFVVPSTERRPIVGCTFGSVKFPHRAPQGWAVLRVFLGGVHFDEASRLPNHELTDLVMRDLKIWLGVERVPSYVWINRYARSLPHFKIGHVDRVRRIQEGMSRLKGLVLAGNAYGGIGIPDCVHSGELAAESAVNIAIKK